MVSNSEIARDAVQYVNLLGCKRCSCEVTQLHENTRSCVDVGKNVASKNSGIYTQNHGGEIFCELHFWLCGVPGPGLDLRRSYSHVLRAIRHPRSSTCERTFQIIETFFLR